MSEQRQLIVVDTETTGLDPKYHVPIEVAAINVDTGEELHFVPYLSGHSLQWASFEALQINRYFERGVWRDALPQAETEARYQRLFDMLRGNTLGGSNPRFDGDMIRRGYAVASAPIHTGHGSPPEPEWASELWHHRLAPLESYAAGALHLPPQKLVGLSGVCEALGFGISGEHTALGDARAAVAAFRILMDKYTAQNEPAS